MYLAPAKIGLVVIPSTIRIRSAPETAAQAIRDAITEGRLKPGDRILEQHWATALGIGQPTLREAFKELEYEGLLTRNPRRGTYVTDLSPEDCALLLEVRMPLELIAVDRATRRMNDTAAEKLARIVARMEDAAKNCDASAIHDADLAFHRAIWELAGNQYLRAALESMATRLFVFTVLGGRPHVHEDFHEMVQQHKGMLAGLCTGNPAQARKAFLSNALIYWNRHCKVDLTEEAALEFVALTEEVRAHGRQGERVVPSAEPGERT